MRKYLFLLVSLLSVSVCAQLAVLPAGMELTGSAGSASVSVGQVRYITTAEVQSGVQQWYLFSYTVSAASGNDAFGTVSGSGTYLEGTSVTLTATPAEHYHFTGWSNGVTTQTITITVTSDTTLMAAFAIDQFVVNGETYDYGATVTLTASAPDCQHFVQWSNGETTQTITVTVTSDSTVTALYETTQYLVSFRNADGTTLQADSADCGSMPAYTGATPARDATLQYTYTFKGWLPALEEVSADAVYTAEYDSVAVVYLLDVSVLHGSYTLSPEGEYHYGDTVSITVLPDEGYKWVSWADGVTDNPRVVVLLSDTALSAECVDIKSALLSEEEDRVGAVKFIRDGKIFILTPEGRIYDSTGKRVE